MEQLDGLEMSHGPRPLKHNFFPSPSFLSLPSILSVLHSNLDPEIILLKHQSSIFLSKKEQRRITIKLLLVSIKTKINISFFVGL